MKLTYFYCLAFPLLGILGCAKQHNVSQKETKVEVIGDFFPNEVRPVASKPCFAGAYYRKLVSSVDNWVGISGTVVLPQITFDESRKNPKNTKQYLDNPSVYLGGLMDGQETDIGLSWEVIKDKDGKVSESRVAFRPFCAVRDISRVSKLFLSMVRRRQITTGIREKRYLCSSKQSEMVW